MLQALLITATVLVLLCCIYFMFKRSYTTVVLMLLFYTLNLFHCTFPYAIIYYIKWGLFCGIAISWTFLSGVRNLYGGNIINKKPLIFGLLFISSSIVSAFLSVNPAEALIRASSFLLLTGISLAVITGSGQEERTWEVLRAIYYYDIIVVSLSLLGAGSSSLWEKGRLVGLLYPHATVMVVYAYSSFIVAFAFLCSRNKNRWFHLLVVVGSVLVIILTQSRAGYFAALCGMLFVVGSLLLRKGLIILTSGLLLGMVAFALFATVFVQDVGETMLRGSSVEEIGGPRLYYMQRAIKYFLKNPFFGIGMGTIPAGVKVEDSHDQPFASASGRVANQAGYHLLLVETGAFGLLFYLCWLFTSFFAGWSICKRLKEAGNKESLPYYAAFLGLFVAYAAHGIFEGYPSGAGNIVAVRMWVLAGLFMAFKPLPQGEEEGLLAPRSSKILLEKA